LRNAARDGLSKAMQLLLAVGTNVNAVDEEGKTVLCVAACSGCCDTVRTLLEHGAQVRMRCPDGREPLDFAGDESVKQLLLVEVEKLRMGLLDELLAGEDGAGKSNKAGKGKKSKKVAKTTLNGANSAEAGESGGHVKRDSSTPNAVNDLQQPTEALDEGASQPSGSAAASAKGGKKKKKGKSGSTGAAAVLAPEPCSEPAAPQDGPDGLNITTTGGDDQGGSSGGESPPENGVVDHSLPPHPRASPKKNSKAGSRAVPNGVVKAQTEPASLSLLDAAVHVLSGQAHGLSMRVSSLISTLYDRSATFKEEIKSAGGAKLWLAEHSDSFVLDTDCNPGHESVKLRTPQPRTVTDGLPPPACASAAVAVGFSESAQDGSGDIDGSGSTANGMHVCSTAAAPVTNASTVDAPHSGTTDGNGRPRRPEAVTPFGLVGEGLSSSATDLDMWGEMGRSGEDDLSGLGEDVDPLQLEKKIRGVQKKLRRVQQIEEQAGNGLALDSGQQTLRSSKLTLQASLQQLLQKWALLEPVLIEQQAQRMLAIANSECAVCLDEYSPEKPAIRTSCCGYHFHKQCLQQCIESKNHCPICFSDKATCRVVEQRVRTNAHA